MGTTPIGGGNWWQAPAARAQPARSPVRIGVSSTAALNASPAYQALTAAKKAGSNIPVNNAAMDRFYQTSSNTQTTPYKPTSVPAIKRTSTASSGGSRGGGGGGGAAAPAYSQGQLDWLTQLLARSKPGAATANTLDLPDFQGQALRAFDPSMYNDLRTKLGEAVGQSRTGADTAYNNLGNYLTSNYRNAFSQGAPQAQMPGQTNQAMQRFMQSQGMDPTLANQQMQGFGEGQGALSSLWGLLGANEDTNQSNRLNRVQMDRGTTNMALDAAQLGGMTGIGMQQGQAQQAWQQRADDRDYQNNLAAQQVAQQEAMENWNRQNQVSDLNVSNANSYTNAQMQALLGLLPELKGSTLNMPDLNTLLAGR